MNAKLLQILSIASMALAVGGGALRAQMPAAGAASAEPSAETFLESLTPDFFVKLGQDPAFESDLRKRLADARYRAVGSTRSVRVQLWTETTTESPAVVLEYQTQWDKFHTCLLYTSPSPRDRTRSRMPSSA